MRTRKLGGPHEKSQGGGWRQARSKALHKVDWSRCMKGTCGRQDQRQR